MLTIKLYAFLADFVNNIPSKCPGGAGSAGAAILAGFSAVTDQREKSKFVLDKRRPAHCAR